MAEIINLRKARKAKARADKEAEAAENRAKFGQPKGATGRARIVRRSITLTPLGGHFCEYCLPLDTAEFEALSEQETASTSADVR